MQLTPDIASTLTLYAKHLQSTHDEWWVIGSAAVALHGTDPGPINDIDILVSVPDALQLAKKWQCPNTANTGSERFRSRVLLKPGFGNFPVQIMAGLAYRKLGKWQLLAPKTRQKVLLKSTTLFIPERAEFIEILRSFGRTKDIVRADLMLQ